jgi:hypothetical protein
MAMGSCVRAALGPRADLLNLRSALLMAISLSVEGSGALYTRPDGPAAGRTFGALRAWLAILAACA